MEYDDSFDNTLVVDGIPVIDKSKLDKLLTKISKEFSRKGVSIKADDIFMPWDDSTGKSKGCVYLCVAAKTRSKLLSGSSSSSFATSMMQT